ncbi:MAG: gliding motility-associated C-terminal domain-containing protein, partial [Bacteroidales bacterium]|nr:gliding motility-associated C-terminal domain-containing protein [Bacteroidales bacterium]
THTCITKMDSVQVIVYQSPSISCSSNSPVCSGNDLNLYASGIGTFAWSGPMNYTSNAQNPVINQVTTNYSGLYTVTITDVNGCTNSATTIVVVNSSPIINFIGNNSACEGGQISLTATGADTYLWSGPNNFTAQSNSIVLQNVTNIQSGLYWLTATLGNCQTIQNINITVYQNPNVAITGDTTIIIGESTMITATGANQYFWYPDNNISCTNCPNPIVSPQQTSSYCVIGTDNNNCIDTTCISIVVDTDCGELFFPLSFTPNGDGKNDVWMVRGRCIKNIEVIVYNRWGEKVFEAYDLNKKWDGTYQGKALDTDVYVYVVKLKMITGEEKIFKGDITLLR